VGNIPFTPGADKTQIAVATLAIGGDINPGCLMQLFQVDFDHFGWIQLLSKANACFITDQTDPQITTAIRRGVDKDDIAAGDGGRTRRYMAGGQAG